MLSIEMQKVNKRLFIFEKKVKEMLLSLEFELTPK